MEKVKLGEVLIYEQPTRYIVESDRYDDTFKTPVLTAGKSFLLGYTNETQGIFNELPVIIFDDFTTAIKFVDFPFKVKSSAMKILKPNKEKADIRYLYYKMLTIKTDSEQHKRYWISKYSQIEIPLPPLHIQKAIAAKLDKAQEIISYNQQLLEKYDQLTQSLFIDMFGDPVKNEMGWEKDILGHHCIKIQIGPFGSQLHLSEYVNEGIPLINPINIKRDFINYESSVKITQKKFESLPNYHLKTNDIIMSRRGDLSKIGIVNKEGTFCGTGSLYLRLKESLKPKYCYYLLSQKSTIKSLYEKAQGITMPNLNKQIIFNLEVIVPDENLQNQFAERVAQIEIQKTMAQESLAKSQQLFQSLLKESFK